MILRFTVFLIFSLFSESSFSQLRTVKTNHTDVNLWGAPGRVSGTTLAKIRKLEEVQVLGQRRLANGEIWYRVELRRYSQSRAEVTTGWVDAKYFDPIDQQGPVDRSAMKSTEARGDCLSCLGSPGQKNRQDLYAVGSKVQSDQGFIWPVRGVMRSAFGNRRHPIKRVVKMHRGVDISGNAGAKVFASKGGKIEVSASGCRVGRRLCNKGAGNMITIDHGDGTKSRYLHLSETCVLPRQGTRISQGEQIGCVGATGAVTGPHLHFEVIKKGTWINPLTVLPDRSR
jgi:murein DD-endopeptidase MepM/ murein hydrolase activator NlpD